jgi:hypothetical protein
MAGSFCFNVYTVRFKLLTSTLTPQGRDIVNLKVPHFDKDEIEYLTENRRQMKKIDKKDYRM